MTSQGGQNNVKMLAVAFTDEGGDRFLTLLMEVDGRIRAEFRQGPQDLLIAHRRNNRPIARCFAIWIATLPAIATITKAPSHHRQLPGFSKDERRSTSTFGGGSCGAATRQAKRRLGAFSLCTKVKQLTFTGDDPWAALRSIPPGVCGCYGRPGQEQDQFSSCEGIFHLSSRCGRDIQLGLQKGIRHRLSVDRRILPPACLSVVWQRCKTTINPIYDLS
jgi:hypothetical protein